MIAATVRARLTAADFHLALELLAQGRDGVAAGLQARAEAEGPDVLWDDARLWPALRASRSLARPSAALFVYVALRRLLLDLGVDQRDLTDYGAAVVLAFGRGDRAWRISAFDENRYAYVVDLLEECRRADGERQFRVLAHLGNFALWYSGMFPDYIAARSVRKGGPGLGYYEAAGRGGFRGASDHRLADRYGLSDLLGEAGARFAVLRVAMNRLSDELLFPDVHSPDRMLRQAADAVRFGPRA